MTRRRLDPPLTLAEHEQLGAELHRMRERLVHLEVELARRYGSSRPLGRRATRARVLLDNLRSSLDDQLARDHPADFRPSVYYPAAPAAEETTDRGDEAT